MRMERKKILINDVDPLVIADLRRLLIAAGFDVRIAEDATKTLDLVDNFRPDLIVSEVRLPMLDGARLLREVRSRPTMQNLPFIMIGQLKTVEERVNVMNLPIDDYAQKPFDAEDMVARIENLIKEYELVTVSQRPRWQGFSGNLTEMNLVDLVQTLEVGRKTCLVRMRQNDNEGNVYFADGQVIDAELGKVQGRHALLRMFTWSEGTFQVDLEQHDRARVLTVPNRDLISEGMTRQYRWDQLKLQLPSLHAMITYSDNPGSMTFDEEELSLLAALDRNRAKRILDVVEEHAGDDLRALTVLKRLYERGVIKMVEFAANPQHDELEHLRRLQSDRLAGADRFGQVAQLMLRRPPEKSQPQDRRQTERRIPHAGRRQHDRLSSHGMMASKKLYLNKSELLMIREKLAN